jgi:hypothetical protein
MDGQAYGWQVTVAPFPACDRVALKQFHAGDLEQVSERRQLQITRKTIADLHELLKKSESHAANLVSALIT